MDIISDLKEHYKNKWRIAFNIIEIVLWIFLLLYIKEWEETAKNCCQNYYKICYSVGISTNITNLTIK